MLVGLVACGAGPSGRSGTSSGTSPADPSAVADVVGVSVTGDPGDYAFAVSIRSEETGCDQYADWWEVVTPAGDLVFRRILNHSHPTEQPFTRDGGPVEVAASDEVFVRAHLHPTGYLGQIARGSAESGFEIIDPEPGFAAELAKKTPLPGDCWF